MFRFPGCGFPDWQGAGPTAVEQAVRAAIARVQRIDRLQCPAPFRGSLTTRLLCAFFLPNHASLCDNIAVKRPALSLLE